MNNITLPQQLTEFLDSLPPAAARRVLDAPIERWRVGRYVDNSGRRCLLGHAEDWEILENGVRPKEPLFFTYPIGGLFDDLADEYGLEPVVTKIQEYLNV